MILKVLYCVFLALLMALFAGWGANALQPAPEWELVNPGIERYVREPQLPSAEELKLLSPGERRAKFQRHEAKLREWKAQ